MKATLYLLIAGLLPAIVFAQEAGMKKNPEGLRADNKIWVVMAVCLTILFGLIALLIRIDRKLHQLENNSGT
jgi:hypothetical protein